MASMTVLATERMHDCPAHHHKIGCRNFHRAYQNVSLTTTQQLQSNYPPFTVQFRVSASRARTHRFRKLQMCPSQRTLTSSSRTHFRSLSITLNISHHQPVQRSARRPPSPPPGRTPGRRPRRSSSTPRRRRCSRSCCPSPRRSTPVPPSPSRPPAAGRRRVCWLRA